MPKPCIYAGFRHLLYGKVPETEIVKYCNTVNL